MKKYLVLSILFFALTTLQAQTNVGGGIYSNTTWALANSPYIVVDTVVVFPGVTLTIEPGVVVKFDDNIYLEIRQGTLIANGSATDSITFTSNSSSPTPGIWGGGSHGIWLNNASFATSFNFINVKYSTTGIYNNANHLSNLKNSNFNNNLIGLGYIENTQIDSCNFKFNGTGIYYLASCSLNFCTISNNTNGIDGPFGGTEFANCTIDSNQVGVAVSEATYHNCTISYNQTGVSGQNNTFKNCSIDYNTTQGLYLVSGGHNTDSVINCEIKYNGIGIIAGTCGGNIDPHGLITQCVIENNATGIQLRGCSDIYCNSFCNNTLYDLQNLLSSSYNVANNYWCTSDSATIEAHIYDGYDNTSLGLVSFMPTDSTCSPGTPTAINELANQNAIHIFPNPAHNTFSISSPKYVLKSLEIYNLLGAKVFSEELNAKNKTINTTLQQGIYYVVVNEGAKNVELKLVIE